MFKIKVLKRSKKWYWKLLGGNNETLAHSENYSTRNKAEQTAVKVFFAIDDCTIDEETWKRNVEGWVENKSRKNIKCKPRRIRCGCDRPE